MRRSLAIAALWSIALPAAAIEVDGRINSDEWAGAKHVTDFKLTQPLSRAPGPHPRSTMGPGTATTLAS